MKHWAYLVALESFQGRNDDIVALGLRQTHCQAEKSEDHRLPFAGPSNDGPIIRLEDLECRLVLPFVRFVAETSHCLLFQHRLLRVLLEPGSFLPQGYLGPRWDS